MNNELIGIWKTNPAHTATQQAYGNAIMEFRDNGELIYTIIESDKEQKILLTYEIAGNLLITDQPSFPRKEKTEFILTGLNLELNFNGDKSSFVKIG